MTTNSSNTSSLPPRAVDDELELDASPTPVQDFSARDGNVMSGYEQATARDGNVMTNESTRYGLDGNAMTGPSPSAPPPLPAPEPRAAPEVKLGPKPAPARKIDEIERPIEKKTLDNIDDRPESPKLRRKPALPSPFRAPKPQPPRG